MANYFWSVFVGSLLVVGSLADKTEGTFKWNNRNCEWKELGKSGSHDRTLKITCPAQGKKVPQIKCFYDGDPHDCSWYSGHEKQYYECLVKALVAAAQSSPCDLTEVSCDHDNQCKAVYMEKRSAKMSSSCVTPTIYSRTRISALNDLVVDGP